MINQIVPALLLCCAVLHWNHYLFLFAYLTIFINSLYFLNILKNACKASTLQRILTGQVSSIMLYFVFLLISKQSVFLYYLPVLMSSAGKLYLILEQPSKIEQQLIRQLISLQCKSQIFNIFYYILETLILLLMGDRKFMSKFIKLILLSAYLKYKYTFDPLMRQSFRDVHFLMDRVSKFVGCRALYHSCYGQFVRLGRGDLSEGRQIGYF